MARPPTAPLNLRLVLTNDRARIREAAAEVGRALDVAGIRARETHDLLVCMDEVLSNVIAHGFPDGGEHVLELAVSQTGDLVRMEVTDDGIAFDPLAPQAEPAGSPLEREPGHQGLVILHALADRLEYRREAGRNRLIVDMRIRASGGAGSRGQKSGDR
ncbi:MAG: ATP-binding protein [Chromatiaceae bacterium]|nr:ATP-binding protein [Chromatiaceae bacterium]MCP5315838.1 ATP-binding protein [Chromatiaceae bacterium]